MSTLHTLKYCVLTAVAGCMLMACKPTEPEFTWKKLSLDADGLEVQFPCAPQFGQTRLDFGAELGPVFVNMIGCDAVDSTFVVSHWVLDDAQQAGHALSMWQAAVLGRQADHKPRQNAEGAWSAPKGAMSLPQSSRIALEGLGPMGWVIFTDALWFARQEGNKAHIYHVVVYAPKGYQKAANTFFESIVVK